jgi:hypothetical protein
MNIRVDMNSDEQLLRQFVTPQMYVYFRVKNPDIDADVLRIKVIEVLKYLILAPQFPGNILFGQDMDDIWHLWIMQSRQYAKLCEDLPFERFRHHESNDHPDRDVTWDEAEALASAMIAEKASGKRPSHGAETGADRFQQNAKRLLSFFATYIRTFGPLKAEAVPCWPPVERMMRGLGWNLDQFNAFLLREADASARAEKREPAMA